MEQRYDLKPKTHNQINYIRAVVESDITFAVGPAGSGKTHIASSMACQALLRGTVDKIILTRPVVESSEHSMGFLPGDLNQKIHPYLVPLLDEVSLYFRRDEVIKMMTERKIEIVPLNFMRGRNFHHSFIIGDEFQNATYAEIKMFLTRTGFESKVVVTGDITQSDIHNSGLEEAIRRLRDVEGVSFVELTALDIVRSKIVERIAGKL